jgi:hypothetical protein
MFSAMLIAEATTHISLLKSLFISMPEPTHISILRSQMYNYGFFWAFALMN